MAAEEPALDTDLVELSGDLDMATAHDVVVRIVEATDEVQVIVDLSAVEFMDSTGLWALLEAKRLLEEEDRTMIAVNPTAQMMCILDVTQMGAALGIETDA